MCVHVCDSEKSKVVCVEREYRRRETARGLAKRETRLGEKRFFFVCVCVIQCRKREFKCLVGKVRGARQAEVLKVKFETRIGEILIVAVFVGDSVWERESNVF